jgi:hypothetical protein
MIKGVPKFQSTYQQFIEQARKFSDLSPTQQSQYTPHNSYENGWDRGIESFNGYVDKYKGSYYATYPDGCTNIWPLNESWGEEYRQAYLELT